MLISTSLDDLRIFADPLRAQIVEMLARERLCNCHLVERTGARQTTISHHLKYLREHNWVDTEAVGRSIYYSLRPEMLSACGELLIQLSLLATAAQREAVCP